MAHRRVYPFTAIVGQERMKRALILNAVNPQIGGVLIRGERGTAKSTAARGLAALLPDIEVVVGSPFNLSPDQLYDFPLTDGREVKTALCQTPFVDLPVSATEDRVVGTLDIEKAIKSGEKHFEPGVLAAANRGILYVDEVNLLDDHVVDLLLDSAAMGVNIVEREGISFVHPAKFVLVGSMNPEEGDLRPQLLDRFAFCVTVGSLLDARQRVEIMERRIAFETDPENFYVEWAEREKQLSTKIARARDMVNQMGYSRRDLLAIASVTATYKIDGHRGDLVILRGAQAHAAFQGRERITQEDIALAAELALPHRIKGRAGQEASISAGELNQVLNQLRLDSNEDEAQEIEQATAPETGEVKKNSPLRPTKP